MKRLLLYLIFFLSVIKLFSQDHPQHWLEFGSGHNFELENKLTIPVYAKYVFEPYVNSEYGLKLQWNSLFFGDKFIGIITPSRTIESTEAIIGSKNLLLAEFSFLKRVRLFKKQRKIGVGIHFSYNNKIAQYNQPPGATFGSSLQGWGRGVSAKWQEQSRNFVHYFDAYWPIGSFDNNLPIAPQEEQLSYTIGYRFPIKKLEEPADEDFIGWKSILIDSSYKATSFNVGMDVYYPINFNASSISLGMYIEARKRWNKNFDLGFIGSLPVERREFGTDWDNVKGSSTQRRYLHFTKGMTNFIMFSNYYLKTSNLEVFMGGGIGVYHRKRMVVLKDQTSDFESFYFPEQLNVGLNFRTGYQIGKLRHTIAFNFTGKEIPDYFSTEIGINFGFGKKGNRY